MGHTNFNVNDITALFFKDRHKIPRTFDNYFNRENVNASTFIYYWLEPPKVKEYYYQVILYAEW